MGLDLLKKLVSMRCNLYFCSGKYKDMSWRTFFEGIQSFSEEILFWPFEQLRVLDTSNWWGSNVVSWLFLAIGFVAFLYWMKELKTFNDNGEEDKSVTSHSYLG